MVRAQLELPATVTVEQSWECYEFDGERIARSVRRRSGTVHRSSVPRVDGLPEMDAAEAFDWCWRRGATRGRESSASPGEIRIADLFSGGGFMTLGAIEAARALGMRARPSLFLDTEKAAANACKRNFQGATTLQ